MSDECLFCRIVRREIPASIIAEVDDLIAFRDVNPQAPVHFLVIPKAHLGSLNDASSASAVGAMMLLAATCAKGEGLADGGYRVVVNTNADGGQTVHHLHAHVLGGRKMTWPPG